jgi:hypothetical protein
MSPQWLCLFGGEVLKKGGICHSVRLQNLPIASSENCIDPLSLATGGSDLFLAVVFEDQGLGIQSEQMHQRRSEIVGGHDIFHRAMTKLVSGSVHHSRPDSATSQPDAEALSIVIPTILLG